MIVLWLATVVWTYEMGKSLSPIKIKIRSRYPVKIQIMLSGMKLKVKKLAITK